MVVIAGITLLKSISLSQSWCICTVESIDQPTRIKIFIFTLHENINPIELSGAYRYSSTWKSFSNFSRSELILKQTKKISTPFMHIAVYRNVHVLRNKFCMWSSLVLRYKNKLPTINHSTYFLCDWIIASISNDPIHHPNFYLRFHAFCHFIPHYPHKLLQIVLIICVSL